ncbi:MAG: LytTR family transcriptional regulator [Sphingobacteriaceae bacterium]|nr:LytTR family transcriptional regulator [Sphingobacteriaceae bacterium]
MGRRQLYCTTFTKQRKCYDSKQLKHQEDLLAPPPQFMRIHRSYIVNKRFINAFNRADNGYVEVQQTTSLSVGSLYKQEVASLFEN